MWPDVELAVVDLLSTLGSAGTWVPDDLLEVVTEHGHYLRVTRFGGGDDRITDTARVDVEIFSADRTGLTVAETARQLLLAGPHYTDGVVLDQATTVSGPVEVPWGGAPVRRWTASYQIDARRRTTPQA